jgi:hypothetical protein
MRDYNPDAMFPKKATPSWSFWEAVAKRWMIIVVVSAFVLLVGAGCQNIKSVELDFGGLDVEYFPGHPSQEEKSIFNFGSVVTNRVNVIPANWDGPLLMPMARK